MAAGLALVGVGSGAKDTGQGIGDGLPVRLQGCNQLVQVHASVCSATQMTSSTVPGKKTHAPAG
jgi:hypothetical protein